MQSFSGSAQARRLKSHPAADPQARAPIAVMSSALPDMSTVARFALTQETGLDGLEIAYGPGQLLHAGSTASQADAIRELAMKHEISVPCMALTIPLTEASADAHSVARTAQHVGAGAVRVYAPQFRPTASFSTQLDAARAQLATLCTACAAVGVRVFVEMAPASIAPSTVLAAHLVEGVAAPEHVGIVYDPGSSIGEGFLAPDLAIAAIGAKLAHVHVKNASFTPLPDGNCELRTCSLTEGLIDWCAVINALARHDYDGWYTFDHLADGDPAESLRTTFAEFRALLLA